MKITYDQSANAVYIYFKTQPVAKTEDDESGNLIIDYSANGSIVGIEVLNASDKFSSIIPEFFELGK